MRSVWSAMSSMTLFAGRYRLEDRIAVGGVGEVWRGVDAVLARPVAVKLLRAEYAGHAEILARFRAEARHAGSVSHPAIAQIHDYGEPDPPQPPYLVMELVDGPSLAGLLAARRLDPATTMNVIAQAAAGLHAAHLAGLVHRDIKPANLLVAPYGNVKITDFGVAHAAGSAPITLGGRVVGTPAYLAPERLTGASATPAADLYALGVVAYECLAGGPPFTGMPMEVAAAHRELPLPPLPATVPADVATLVGELTAKDPAARPGSAAEVSSRAAHLRDAMGGGALPPCLRPETITRTLPQMQALGSNRRFAARSAALAVAAVLAAGLLGLLVGGVFAGTPPAPRPSASPRMVDVGGSLAGQRVSAVQRQLRQLGLVVRVLWRPSGEQAPGTVLSVLPSGRMRAGSLVIVTGALQVPGNGHGQGKGQGHGGDTGPGNGDGG